MHPNMIQQPSNLFLRALLALGCTCSFSHRIFFGKAEVSSRKENMMSQLEWWFGVVVALIQKSTVGDDFKYVFYPILGKISNLTNIFEMGWNHQLEIVSLSL